MTTLRTLMPLLTLAAAISVEAPSNGQDELPAAPRAGAELVTRFYNISHLVTPQQQFPFRGGLPTGLRTPAGLGSGFGGMGGGLGGMGGGGLGGSGGGGFFNVPVAAAQFGGMQGGGFGGGGLDLGTSGDAQAAKQLFLLNNDADSIMELIVEHVATNTWADHDGEGTYRGLGNVLLIRQTEVVHTQIREFLNQLSDAVVGDETLVIETWWMPLDDGERANLEEVLERESATEVSRLTTEAGGFHGSMRCRDRVTANMASGHRLPLVISRVPIVGGESAGEQPIVDHVNVGLFLEVTPDIVPDWLMARNADEPTHVAINYRTAITSMEPDGKPESRPGEIDRFQMGAHVVEGAAVMPIGRPVVVGTLSSIAIQPIEGNDKNEVVLVMMATKVSD